MKRALLAAAIAVLALGGCRAHAQPVVAKLEVVKASKQTPSQHERIEQKLDQVLNILKGKPPVVDPPKPVEPTAPAGPNPFIAWREQGLTLVDISMWRLGRGLTDAELEQAYAAGYPRGGAPAGGSGGSRNGFHVTVENSPRVNVLQNGQPYTFLLGHPGTVRVFGVSGTQLNRVNGRDVIGGDDIQVAGTSLVLTVEGIGAFGPPEVGVQLVGQ